MTTLKQKLDIGLLPNNLAREQQKRDIQIFKEWLQQNVKKTFYKNLMPDFSGETQKKIEKSIKELLNDLNND